MWHTVESLKFDVVRGNKVVIPAGTPNVEICFRAAKWQYVNNFGELVHGNLYRVDGKVY